MSAGGPLAHEALNCANEARRMPCWWIPAKSSKVTYTASRWVGFTTIAATVALPTRRVLTGWVLDLAWFVRGLRGTDLQVGRTRVWISSRRRRAEPAWLEPSSAHV